MKRDTLLQLHCISSLRPAKMIGARISWIRENIKNILPKKKVTVSQGFNAEALILPDISETVW